MSKTVQESQINQEWQTVRFDEICGNISIRVENPKESGSSTYVGLEHLEPEQLKIRKHGTPDDVYATKLRFKRGQILFGKRRFYQRKLAVADLDGICSAHMLVLEAKTKKIVKEFLPFFMQSEEFYMRALMVSEGSLSPTIKWRNLAKQEFLIPSITKQNSIIKIMTSIDKYKQATEELSDKFTILRELIRDRLLYNLLQTDFKSSENQKKHDITSLSTICRLRDDEKLDSNLYLGLENIESNSNLLRSKEQAMNFFSSKNSFRFGDVLYGKLRPNLNKVWLANEDGYCSKDILPLQPNEKILPEILLHTLSCSKFVSYAISRSAGTKMPRVNWSDIKKFKINPISLQEQQKIVFTLKQVDERIQSLRLILLSIVQTRKSILHSLLTPPKEYLA